MGEARHYKPTYHAYIPKGWCNDPNGMIYYNGTNHLYFQHYPYNAAWGTMHWGHFTSKDFIKWELQPVALRPDQDYEVICGCCSGNAVEKDGKLYIMYTAAQPDRQRQCLAWSEDGGITFTKEPSNPILTAEMLSPEVSTRDFRDPKIFEKDGWYYCLYGCRIVEYKGGDFVSFPSRKGSDDKYYNHVWVKLSDDDTAAIVKQVEEML
jgi:beta-fructofuranosidase